MQKVTGTLFHIYAYREKAAAAFATALDATSSQYEEQQCNEVQRMVRGVYDRHDDGSRKEEERKSSESETRTLSLIDHQ